MMRPSDDPERASCLHPSEQSYHKISEYTLKPMKRKQAIKRADRCQRYASSPRSHEWMKQ